MTEEQLDRHAYLEGLRTADWSYVEYGSGERELYHLGLDPHQLSNIVDDVNPALPAALSRRLSALARCAGQRCRELEDLPLGDGGLRQAATQP